MGVKVGQSTRVRTRMLFVPGQRSRSVPNAPGYAFKARAAGTMKNYLPCGVIPSLPRIVEVLCIVAGRSQPSGATGFIRRLIKHQELW